MRGIDFDVHNVIAGRHTSNVDPLTQRSVNSCQIAAAITDKH
jgi:hypothetical protein